MRRSEAAFFMGRIIICKTMKYYQRTPGHSCRNLSSRGGSCHNLQKAHIFLENSAEKCLFIMYRCEQNGRNALARSSETGAGMCSRNEKICRIVAYFVESAFDIFSLSCRIEDKSTAFVREWWIPRVPRRQSGVKGRKKSLQVPKSLETFFAVRCAPPLTPARLRGRDG